MIPLLNEKAVIANLTSHLRTLAQANSVQQVIFVDGGSQDGTLAYLQSCIEEWSDAVTEFLILQSGAGRARQMNVGAQQVTADVIVFLHADSELPRHFSQQVSAAAKQTKQWGFFAVRFIADSHQKSDWRLSVIAFFMAWRSRLTGIATGDQALFVKTALFRSLKGFADIPLMEDVEICKRLRKTGRPYCSRQRVITSARRWLKHGVIKTVLLMWRFRLMYFLGVSPETLAKQYRNVR